MAGKKASWRDGLPYGWWKDQELHAAVFFALFVAPLIALLLYGWFFDVKPWW